MRWFNTSTKAHEGVGFDLSINSNYSAKYGGANQIHW
jgi:hypothetical protein